MKRKLLYISNWIRVKGLRCLVIEFYSGRLPSRTDALNSLLRSPGDRSVPCGKLAISPVIPLGSYHAVSHSLPHSIPVPLPSLWSDVQPGGRKEGLGFRV